MKAEPFNCHHCRRLIGQRRTHLIVNGHVLCIRCMEKRELHPIYWPDCPEAWHDMYDHGLTFATRAAAQWTLAKQGSTP